MHKLKKLRLDRGYNRSQLGKELDIDRNYIYMIEVTGRTPSLRLAKKMADFFNTSIDDIFFSVLEKRGE
jgi:putative transcriptional regulator